MARDLQTRLQECLELIERKEAYIDRLTAQLDRERMRADRLLTKLDEVQTRQTLKANV